MTTTVVTLEHDESLDAAEEVMRVGRFHHLPVVKAGRLIGMLAHSDILRAQVSVFAELSLSEDRAIKQKIRASEVMSPRVTTVPPDMSALQAARILRKNDYSSLPVVEGDRVVGIITDRDFLDLAIRALSVANEDDEPVPQNGTAKHADA
jgi:CBS domain-containing membrane protein